MPFQYYAKPSTAFAERAIKIEYDPYIAVDEIKRGMHIPNRRTF